MLIPMRRMKATIPFPDLRERKIFHYCYAVVTHKVSRKVGTMQYRVFPSNPCVCSSLRLPVAITRSLKLYIIFFVDPFVDSFAKH